MKIVIPTKLNSLINDKIPNLIVNENNSKYESITEKGLSLIKRLSIHYLRANNLIIEVPCNGTMSKDVLGDISYKCFKIGAIDFEKIMSSSSSTDNKSYIIQALLGNQSKLTNSVLRMNKEGLYGQMYLIRSILEDCAIIGWLLNDKNGSIDYRMNQYMGRTLINTKRYVNDLKNQRNAQDGSYTTLHSKVLHQLQYTLKETGWPKDKIKDFENESNTKLKERYKKIPISRMLSDISLPLSYKLQEIYWDMCGSVHASFPNIISQQVFDKSGNYRVMSKAPLSRFNFQALSINSFLLYITFHIVFNYGIFSSNKRLLKNFDNIFSIIDKDTTVIEFLMTDKRNK